ncbi:probable aspartic proteinase GIP2 [Trifolium pratense]|uniref:probable aspartic proteinase GIP2 n=1 Tax=Trifolium pratense TaxID=57577 RepID=UPI001E693358|nr:probable aspartic proteinase GIP2 [Trifolium pratense]
MAFSFFLPLFFSLLIFVSSSSNSLLLPISKDNITQQYLTTLSYGTPFVSTNVVVDLSGSFFWLDCSSRKISSFSLRTIPHRSLQCLTAKSHSQTWLSNLEENHVDQDYPCEILPKNTITGKLATKGNLVEDFVAIQSNKDSIFKPTHDFLFTCSNTLLLNGLSNHAKGIVGFGRSRTSFSSQFFNSMDSQRKITFCLSSSSGFVLLGKSKNFESENFRSLTFTPLVTNQNMEYLINVNSIKIGGKKVSFNTQSLSQEGYGGTLLSSILPYTTMQSSIYENFKSAFLKAALSMNMIRVPAVAPFEICFGSKGIDESQIGPNVPIIDFVLQSEMVKWRIYGRNSMVRVSDDVMCLGILDGGVEQKNPIVIGGYQLEDVLVQFDLDNSMVGFSSSLLIKDTSCSNFIFDSMDVQSS